MVESKQLGNTPTPGESDISASQMAELIKVPLKRKTIKGQLLIKRKSVWVVRWGEIRDSIFTYKKAKGKFSSYSI